MFLFPVQWQQNATQVHEQGSAILEALKEANKPDVDQTGSLPPLETLNLCVTQLKKSYEPKMGGFGKAPKFPQPGK